MTAPKVLMVLSSDEHGWYLPEFAHPYHVLSPIADITIASPAGGEAPLAADSVEASKEDTVAMDFVKTQSALWKNTVPLSEVRDKALDFAAVFYVGGYGPMYDVVSDETSHAIIRAMWEAGKIVSAVCHGPAALAEVKLSDGSYLINGSAANGFTTDEEKALNKVDSVPFLLEERLKERGGKFEKGPAFQEKVVIGKEGRLLMGQNPASAMALGQVVAGMLKA